VNTMENRKKKEKIISFSMIIVLLVTIIVFFINDKAILTSLNNNFGAKENILGLFNGLYNTLLITILSFIIGIILGMIVSIFEGLNSSNTLIIIIQKIFKVYVSIFRGTPATVQLLIMSFVIFPAYRGDPIYIAILVFGLNSGAYVSEIMRGGINAVSKGQIEAGRSLGLSYFSTMRKIVLPQAIRNAFPSLGNEFITLIKETSIVSFISATDLTSEFKDIVGGTYEYLTVYLVMGLTYFLLVFCFAKLFKFIERKFIEYANLK